MGRDGTLASASHDGTIRLWDAETGLELQTMGGHNGPISSVAYSPDGTTLASASFDGTIKLWHAETGQELQQSPLSGHSDMVFSVAYSPDGTTLASASFSVLAQQALNEDFHDPNDPKVTSSLSNIQLWHVESGSLWKTLSGHTDPIKSVAYSPDGTTLASASDDGTIRLWDAASGLELQTLSGHNGPISSVAYSPDGTTLASASHDPNSSLSNIQLWEVDSGSLLKTL